MSEKSKSDNQIVLSYHDTLLRESDVQLLRGPHWLNDTIIGFYFEYLEKKFADSDGKELLFVSPELTQLLKLSASSDYEILLESINARENSHIFFPLNNCDSRENPGGTHWSLLVYSKREKICFHFDSSKGFNSTVAKNFARNVIEHFCGKGSNEYLEIDIPQQDNSYDCGLFVLCCADFIADHSTAKRELKDCEFSSLKLLVNGKRKKLLELIDYLKNT